MEASSSSKVPKDEQDDFEKDIDMAIAELCSESDTEKDLKDIKMDLDRESINASKHKRFITDWECINFECKTKNSDLLTTASSFDIHYYGRAQVTQKGKFKICNVCHRRAQTEKEHMLERIKNKSRPIFSSNPFPSISCNTLNLDSENHSESDDDSTDDDIVVLSIVNNQSNDWKSNLKSEVDNIMENLEISNLDNTVLENLQRENRKLAEENTKFNSLFDKTEERLNEIFHDITKRFKENDVEIIEELDIVNDIVVNKGEPIFFLKSDQLDTRDAWIPGKVIECSYDKTQVKFEFRQGQMLTVKLLSGKYIARSTKENITFSVGTRVIAEHRQTRAYIAGIVAEIPRKRNNNRYLIFFDNCDVAYVYGDLVKPVLVQNPQIWNEVHEGNKEAVKIYLTAYPYRPMAQLKIGQEVFLEKQGKWWRVNVKLIDGSIALLKYFRDGSTEWVYRGSYRLSPLYLKYRKEKGLEANMEMGDINGTQHVVKPDMEIVVVKKIEKRYVARKSSALRRKGGAGLTDLAKAQRKSENQGETVLVDLSKFLSKRKKFTSHICNPNCMTDPNYIFIEKYWKGTKVTSPLLIPLKLGWSRILKSHSVGSTKVFYKAPCGRTLRNLVEVHDYLHITKSNLEIDFFDFHILTNPRRYFKPIGVKKNLNDISYGKENVEVSAVNTVNDTVIPHLDYATQFLPQKDVVISDDPRFLICCDCTDGCKDIKTCQCLQLTHKEARISTDKYTIGYIYRRLYESVSTGIYECNSNCKCSKTCLNRVAQQPLRLKLQLFYTDQRGWGVRTLHDIPNGAFICCYVGHIYTEKQSEEVAKIHGDMYVAGLDLIEVVENKPGYEEDVVMEDDVDDIEEDEDEEDEEINNDDKNDETYIDPEFSLSYSKSSRISDTSKGTRLREQRKELEYNNPVKKEPGLKKQTARKSTSATSKNKQPVALKESTKSPVTKPQTAEKSFYEPQNSRRFFSRVENENEYEGNDDVYVIDAVREGNLGRYFNHSCSPNMFVQNVFINSHDIRFPHVAFFTQQNVKAGEELTWFYGYDTESTPADKIIECRCGANGCIGRLL